MNDKDKEAFEKWIDSDVLSQDESALFKNMSEQERVVFVTERTWQAACEYKDKEQYIEGSIHESSGIKREMTWKESSDMMERMYQGAIAQLDREYKRIKEFQAELLEYKEAARSEAEEVNRLQAENKKLRQELEIAKSIFREEGFHGAADDIKEALGSLGKNNNDK